MSSLPQHLLRHLESRIAAQKQDLQTLLLDNQRLAASHVALKQELSASHQSLLVLADAASKTRAERDAQITDLIEKLKSIEDEAMRVENTRKELEVVRADVGRFEKEKVEMEEKVKVLKKEVEKVKEESGKVAEVKWEIEYMRHEVDRGRAAIEYEKKIHADNLVHGQRMEESMVSMAREVEKLRAELANAEKRARAAAAVVAPAIPGSQYHEIYGSNEIAYGGSTYANTYGLRQAPGVADGVLQYASTAVPTVSGSSYDIQQTQAHRYMDKV